MTDDPASRAPTEIAGLIPSSGGAMPPNVVAPASPGLSAAAAKPPIAPTLPDPTDPQAMALLFARVANELFGGASVVPVPSPASLATAQGAAVPGSPGISTAAVNPPTGAGGPSDPTALVLPSDLVGVPTSLATPVSPSVGAPQTPTAAGGPQTGYASIPTSSSHVPTTSPTSFGGNPSTSSATSTSPTTFGGNPFGAPTSAGMPASTPMAPSMASPFGTTTLESMFGGAPAFGGGNPFGATHIESLPGGASVIPSPSPASIATAQGVAVPASPGVSTSAINPPTGAGGPSAPTASPTELVGVPTSVATPMSSSPSPTLASAPMTSSTPSVAMPVATSSMEVPGSIPTAPSIASPFGTTTVESMFGGAPLFGGDNPFGATNVESVPGFESTRIPMFDAVSPDVAPYFVPDANHVAVEPAPSDFEVRGDDPLVRDLGRVAFDPHAVRRDFPILEERIHGKRLVWLDNAATTQKPRAVIDRISYYYEHENSNVHRGAHTLAARATDAYEGARETTRRFLNAPSAKDIIWVRGATEGINLIAQSWGRRYINAGDEIVITHLEHHANIVPWQMLCAEKGARLRVAPVDDRGDVILEEYDRLLNPKTRLVSFPQVSNALGTITPAREMVEMAHRHGARVVVDGAQAVSHMPVDVQLLDCDFYVFSGHKVFAPTGIGVVYGKREVLEQTPPWQGGGNMIQDVTFERTTYQPPPGRFEAGTGSIADAVGLGAALDYIMRIGTDVIDRYEHSLLVYGTERLLTVPGLTMIGTSPNKAGVLSFVLDGQRTEDVGAALDKYGIAVRSGHHCAQPIHRRFGLEASVRASLAFYNVCEDIDALVDALRQIQGPRPL